MAKNGNNNQSFEKSLFKAADKLRKNMDAAEYKHIVMGLIFLKYISDSFETLYQKLSAGEGEYEGADPEDVDEYRAMNVFFVPPKARWSFLLSNARSSDIGIFVDKAMEEIERANPTLKGILPKVYARPNLDKGNLGQLLDLIGNIAMGEEAEKTKDILGRVYEYFLGEFASEEGKKGGQFYTPRSIVQLLVEMIEPYHGRVYDPCCGSGGMFVMSEKFVEKHRGRLDDISIFGQESNETTYRLCRMNLAIRGIDGSNIRWNNEGSFLNDAHKDLKADFILANPPFNDSDWSGELMKDDARWQYGIPPAGNANYAWIQHFIFRLAPEGVAGFVLSKGSLTTGSNNEGKIRKRLIEADLIDCIVNLPTKLFYNTQIPACLWFIRRNKQQRKGEILFIDARNLGHLVTRRNREFSENDIRKVADTYHNWRTGEGEYQDEAGFCKSASLDEVKELNYVLTPGRYVGLIDDEEEYVFEERYNDLKRQLEEQIHLEKEYSERIIMNLNKINFEKRNG